MFKNSKKQGDAGLGQAIAYFTMKGYDVALPLTDSADWDMIVEIDGLLKRVQVKTSTSFNAQNTMKFEAAVRGGNKSSSNHSSKKIEQQQWDLIFLCHLVTGKQALIPKEKLETSNQINLGKKYEEYLIN
jgi:hypothetical protein